MRLFVRIIFINLFSVLLTGAIMIGLLFRDYRQREIVIAKEKLFKYWVLENNSFSPNKPSSITRASYFRDNAGSSTQYALRIVDSNNDPILYLFPNTWNRYSMYDLIFPVSTEVPEGGVRLMVRNFGDGTKRSSMLSMYSISTGDKEIQILVSSEERRSLVGHMANTGVTVIILIGILSSIAAILILRSVTLPLNKINALAERIIERKEITERISERRKGEFRRLERNINRMLDTIERLVKRLRFANVSIGHDIRTPLTHIKNNCEEMIEKIDDEETRQKINMCMGAVDEIYHLSQHMLSLSEIESGLISIPKEPTTIGEALEGVVEMYTYIAEERGIIFDVSIHPTVKTYMEVAWIRRFIGNLLDNAMKFTPRGKNVVLRIIKKDSKAVITIADEGKGIADEDLPNIWDLAWKKGQGMHEENATGFGFGLGIVRGIVTAHRGTLTATSVKEQGTIFTVTLEAALSA